MNGVHKVIARHWGFIGGGGSMYRVLNVKTGQVQDLSVSAIYQMTGGRLFAGRCFIPTAVDYPVFHLIDGDQYRLPVVHPQTGECVENDKVIVLFELARGNQVVGYRVTDYSGMIVDLSLDEVKDYLQAGYWNAEYDGRYLQPLNGYVFPKLS